uniref:Cyclic nucleotide-binding domain-containing protein n=1 Tax=Globisporangium ultimum (strain ATCC 200006 / CBS 805.95 / DAOM BR144) TaxID=431595 RepID=K3WFW0_GLOUD
MQQGDAAACDSRTPRHTRATAAAADSDHQFDVEQVRELLDTAARRHRKISDHLVEFGDDSNARQYPVKDARKYDYPLTPVTRPSTAAASLARRGFVSINSGISDAEDSSLVSSSSDTATTSWRDHLQLHVVHLLQKLRAHPVQLRNFLLIQYEDEEEESARRRISVDLGGNDNVDDEDSGEDDGDHAQGDRSAMDENERRARRNRVHKKRMGKNYAKVRLVFKYLHRVAVLMGEQLYHKVHRMLRRSVAHGMLNRQANLVRLDSIYKLELRRQLTVEKLLEAVRLKDAEQKRKRRRQKRDEQHVRKQMQRRKSRMSVAHGGNDGAIETKTPPPNANDAANATDYSNLYSLWEQSIEHNPITSAHFFKMHALERVLAVERQNRDVSFGSSFRLSLDGRLQNSAGELPQRLVSEQTEDLIHEKLTAFLYNKNKDTFPVWKEPPESSFTREETLRHLKRLLPLLMNMPLFHGLSIDQLIEFVRVTQWKAYTHGQKVVQQDTSMDELILIMEGSVDVLSPIGDTGFDYSGIKVEADAANDDTGETDDEDDANFIAPKAGSHLTVKGTPVYFGELGMLSKTEIWTLTLLVKTRTAKILVIPRLAFDLVLQKLFGNSKSRQLLLVAQQRPSSSPTANARTPMLVSPTRPSTAAAIQARDKHLAASRQLQETAVHQKKLRDEQQRAEAEAKNSVERSNVDMVQRKAYKLKQGNSGERFNIIRRLRLRQKTRPALQEQGICSV